MPLNIPFNADSIKLFIPDTSGCKAAHHSLKLSVGEIISGMVLESFGDQKVLISIKGQKIPAHTRAPMTAGEKITFKVEKIAPHIILSLMQKGEPEKTNTENMLSPLLRASIPQKVDMDVLLNDVIAHMSDKDLHMESILGKELFHRLKKGINSFIYTGGKKTEFFKELVSRSGLVFETKFTDFLNGDVSERTFIEEVRKDIKGILLESARVVEEQVEIKDTLKDLTVTEKKVVNNRGRFTDIIKEDIKKIIFESAKIAEEQTRTQNISKDAETANKNKLDKILRTVKQFIDNIEIDQIVNYIAKEERGAFHLQIPFVNGDSVDIARLYIYKRVDDGEGKDKSASIKKDNYYLVFFLDMKRIGDIRVDVYINKSMVNCIFIVENRETAEFIKGYSSDLIEGLQSADFSPSAAVEVIKDMKKTEEIFKRDFNLNDTGMLDLVV